MWFGKHTKWILLAFLSVVWGSSFMLMKKSMFIDGHPTFTSSQLGALRIGISFLFFLPIAIKKSKNLTRDNWKWIVIIGITGNLIPAYLFANAQSVLNSGLIGVMNGMVPLYTLLIGIAFFNMKVKLNQTLGILMGLFGTVLIYFSKGIAWNIAELYAMLMVVIATLCYGLGLNIIHSKLKEIPSLTVSTLSFLFIGPLALIHFFTTDFSGLMEGDTYFLQSFGYVTLLSFAATAVALVAFYHLVSISNSIFASSVTYTIPFVALTWGYFDMEEISGMTIGALFMILFAIGLIAKK